MADRRLIALAALLLSCGEPGAPPALGSSSASGASQSASARPLESGGLDSSARPASSSSASNSGSTSATVPEKAARWLGRVRIPSAMPLEFGLDVTPGTAPSASMDIPSQRVKGASLSNVAFTEGGEVAFTLELPGVLAKFKGRFTSDGSRVEGTFEQSGVTMPAYLRRLGEGESVEDAKRPQTPAAPYPYDEVQASYTSKDGTKLGGTLTLPKGEGPFPAVVLVTGTGEQDRDETLFGHKPFLVLADHLTRAGIAVLRVDDRGVGDSGGSTAAATIADKVDDAAAGLTWLASQPRIDAKKLGVLGHSEGGLIAPLVATRAGEPRVAFVVLLGAPGVDGPVLLRKQMESTLRAQGASPERIKIGMDGQNKVIDAVVANASDDALRVIATAQIDAILGLASKAERERIGERGRQAMIEVSMAQVASPAMRSFIQSSPKKALEKLACPVLALDGSMDLQVAADDNIPAIRAALERGKNPDFTAEIVAGRNHLFQIAELGTMEEWAYLDQTMDPAVLEKISAWVVAHTR
ncbi:MAG: alpha/beta fold hydrolase [Polyangiaceae bacterium]